MQEKGKILNVSLCGYISDHVCVGKKKVDHYNHGLLGHLQVGGGGHNVYPHLMSQCMHYRYLQRAKVKTMQECR